MRALLEEYGTTIVVIILGTGIIGILLHILKYILSGEIWHIWGL